MTKIAVFVGSLRNNSLNKKLAKNIEKVAPKGVEFHYVDLNLPLFNQDLEADFPAAAQTLKDIVEEADGVLFVTPEYNRSISGVLKNAIDWGSRPYGHSSFTNKPAGIIGASSGRIGTAVAQADLRHIVAYLGMKLMGQPELYLASATDLFDADDHITSELRPVLQEYITAFTKWIDNEK